MKAPTMLPKAPVEPISNNLIQSGTATTDSNGQKTVTFPEAYGSTPNIQLTIIGTSETTLTTVTIRARSNTSFTIQLNRSTSSGSVAHLSMDVYWLAIGTPAS